MNTKLPPVLESKLADFRRRVWLVKLTEGVLAAFFGLALSYLLVFGLDRLLETPAWLRATILIAGAATLGLGLPLKWHRWVWRQRRLEDAARLLRRTFPRLGDQLLGIVELARMDHGPAGRSERLVQAAMEQAADAVKEHDFTNAVPEAKHRQWAWAACGAVAVAALAFGIYSDAARNAFARWATPWRDVERYTFTRVEPLPSKLVVPFAEPFEFPVRLTSDTQRSPSAAKARLGDQPQVKAAVTTGGAFPLAFPPQKEDAELALSIGDYRKDVLIQPRPRPELTDIAVRLQLPEYLKYTSPQRLPVHGGTVSIVKGAQAAFEAKASRELTSAELDGKPQTVTGETFVTSFLPVAEDSERKFTWRDQDGLTPRDPLLLKVRAVEDEAPKIIARRETQEQVVLDTEVVNFDLLVSDDFGVKRVGLEWVGSEKAEDGVSPVRGEKVASAGEPEKKDLDIRATFSAAREGVAPQTLEIRAWSEDYLPDRKRAKSASFVLHVLNKTDHALWLTEQLGKWLEVARESYEREQQLHQTNKEIRGMTASELERPENRRKVSQQAAAESGNAARLDALTQSGRKLVEQATKNDEFDAERLESWATMLKSLKAIAATRMPSVSELLKKTASAPAGKPGSTNPAQQGGQPPQQAAVGEKPPGPASEGAPKIAQGEQPASAPNPPAPTDPNALPKPAAPSISDNEKSLSAAATEPKPADPNAAPRPPGGGGLKLPSPTLAAAPGKPGDAPSAPETPAQENLDQAITEQKDLLAEFAKVSDELGSILASLEASTFVKRFKAASRHQMAIASKINQDTLDAFGIVNTPPEKAAPIASKAKDQSQVVQLIQSDLDAYFQRKQDARLKTILDEMKKTEIVRSLARGSEKVSTNLTGQSLMGSEYWADVMDRWAEEMVAATECKSCSTCSSDSLPPEIVLKVMQALRDEMKLRDETRELENSKAALEGEKFTHSAIHLAEKQDGIARHTESAAQDILALEGGAQKFGKELKLLHAVVTVMDETREILGTPETGSTAIAAETEAIELLLQARRMGKGGGGGGGSNPGGGGTAATASSAALADLGPGADADSTVDTRLVGQATGRAGKEFPDEFKPGLEAYFNLLEEQSAGQ